MGSRTIELTIEGRVPSGDLTKLVGTGIQRGAARTVLVADVRDSAALFGLLQRLGSLGVDVVGLRTTPTDDPPEVEIVVRGAIGALMARMLESEDAAPRSSSRTYHLDDIELADLLRLLESTAGRAGPDEHDERDDGARDQPAPGFEAGPDPARKEDG